MILERTIYRGRFAPTPSGPLHLGSMMTALASFLDARTHAGLWLLRIDDLDRERCPPGAAAEILRQLETHGLQWDESPRLQSAHRVSYATAFERLRSQAYACDCNRAALRASGVEGPDGPIYPGTCRDRGLADGSWRLRLPATATTLCFDDAWQGRQCRDLAREVGDFVLRRRDGTFGYQLACAVDEHEQRITHVVRGGDLLGSTFPQQWLQQQLGWAAPRYGHLPVLVDAGGRKLSKQNHATPVDARAASTNLMQCLTLLGQGPPQELAGAGVHDLLEWATGHWSSPRVPCAARLADPSPL
ncbi:MAG TPA: tRNA glutamyl-Q(34) synthetase GluQRS [Verrucomicrobiae bacterium]|nr:tRNA glutamyl-Q(34) synthetase GluQRS [Verrucomicrobiae bacterium]